MTDESCPHGRPNGSMCKFGCGPRMAMERHRNRPPDRVIDIRPPARTERQREDDLNDRRRPNATLRDKFATPWQVAHGSIRHCPCGRRITRSNPSATCLKCQDREAAL